MTSRQLGQTARNGALALLLAACSPGPATVERRDTGLTPALGAFIEIDGKPVHYYRTGSGTAVVLLHGASGNLRDFTFSLAPKLAQDFTVIAFDRPGLGHSQALHGEGESPREQARHMAAALDALGISQAVIVGHSFGAAVAMAWALERPDQAAAIVTLGGALNPWPGGLGAWYDIAGSAFGGAVVVPLVATFAPRRVAENAVAGIFEPDTVPEGYLEYVGPDLTLRTSVLRANARQVGGLRPHVVEMERHYPNLVQPVELVHGDEDTIVPLDIHSGPFANAVPTARLTILDGVGHMPHHADEPAVLAAISRAARRAGLP